MKRLRPSWNGSRREGEGEHRPHGRCDEKRKLVRITTAPAWGGSWKNVHRKGDLAAIPSVILPPPKAAGIALPLREDKYRMMEAFPSDTAMIFREGGEGSKQLIFSLQTRRKRHQHRKGRTKEEGGSCLTPAHTRGRRLAGAGARERFTG